MKKVDIRKIYVGEILKQNSVQVKILGNSVFDVPFSDWDYEEQSQLGLFVRTLGGYKHILTDTIYPQPSKRTGNKYVINPDNIEKLVKRERALTSHLVDKYQSYDMDISVIKALEERINSDAKYLEDESNYNIHQKL